MDNKKVDIAKKLNPDNYPLYPVNEDIYKKSKNEENINPEDILLEKEPNEDDKPELVNEKDFDVEQSGSDLDVPGAELDDEQEKIGSEDEENNYYSLGGDNHNDLDEDRE